MRRCRARVLLQWSAMDLDWQALFGLTLSPLELFVRGSAVYWFLFVIFRVVLRRNIGAVGIADVLFVVLVADAAQNAMAGDYRSITDGFLLIAAIVFWNVIIDWLTYRIPALGAFLEPKKLPLVRDGKILHRNLRQEWITEEELRSKLRQQGVATLSDVRAAYMESDGVVSIITRDRSPRRRGAKGDPFARKE
jgi:uncharacterized membrane protein YcaP (DUF421 family)